MTSTESTTTLHDDLRDWARGSLPLEAATEILIRAGYAMEHSPWTRPRSGGGHWIDFNEIPLLIGAMSSGERRLLSISASLGGDHVDVEISLNDTMYGLDECNARLVLAALAHSLGTPHLAPWPIETAQAVTR